MINIKQSNYKLLSFLIVAAFCFSIFGLFPPVSEKQTVFSGDIKQIYSNPEPIIRKSINQGFSPIIITSNADFSLYASSGNGGSKTPWIIEGYDETISGITFILINGTTDYFVVRNNHFTSPSRHSGTGIYLFNVANGIVSGNTLTNLTYGIRVDNYSSNNLIVSNTISKSYTAITVHHGSNYNSITRNVVSDTSYIAIWTSTTSSNQRPTTDNLYQENIITNAQSEFGAFGDWHSDRNRYINNEVSNSVKAITLNSADNAEVKDNNFHNNNFGIWLESYSDDTPPDANIITGNRVTDGDFGIYVQEGTNNLFDGNLIANNNRYGFYSISNVRSGNTITSNDFIDNNPSGTKQALDNYLYNLYNNSYWKDHDNTDANGDGYADTPYEVDGPFVQNLLDSYPSAFPLISVHTFTGAQITYPNGEETLRGVEEITWSGGSDSSYTLFYTLSYSADGGGNWVDLVVDTTSDSYIWDTNTVSDGNNYLVRVLTDNKHGDTTTDASDGSFSVQNVFLNPVYVVGDEALVALASYLGLPGDGSVEYPFIFENYVFRSSDSVLFEIHDTKLYFTVRNNQFDGLGSGYDGIILNNVINAVFENNDITHSSVGVHLIGSSDVLLDSNDIYAHDLNGVLAENCHDLTISNNNIYNNAYDGLVFVNTHNSLVQGNTIFSNGLGIGFNALVRLSINGLSGFTGLLGSGIFLDPSEYNTLDSNVVYNNGISGLQLLDSNHTTVTNNKFNSNGENGVAVIDSSHGLFSGNDIIGNGYTGYAGDYSYSNALVRLTITGTTGLSGLLGSGIFLDPSSDNTVSNNYVSGNAESGVYLQITDQTIVSGNTISGNGLAGVFVESSSNFEITGNTIGGNGYGVPGSASYTGVKGLLGSGIFLDPSNDGLVADNIISDNANHGVHLYASSGVDVSKNTITSNDEHGIFLEDSSHNTISGNTISDNGPLVGIAGVSGISGLLGSGIFLDPGVDNNVFGNNIFGNAKNGIHLLSVNQSDISRNTVYQNGEHGVFLQDSNHNFVTGNTISGNGGETTGIASVDGKTGLLGSGIFLDPSTDNTVEGNTVSNNAQNGIHLLLTDNSKINNNEVSQNGEHGVFLEDSSHNTINKNTITGNGGQTAGISATSGLSGLLGSGIFLDPSSDNTVEGNIVSNNAQNGIHLYLTDNTMISGNHVDQNGENGIFLEESSGNTIKQNSITGNGYLATTASVNGLTGLLGSGIFLDPGENNIVDDNYVADNAISGVSLLEIGNSQIINNEVVNNGISGLIVQNSSGNLFQGNDIAGNGREPQLASANGMSGLLGSGIFLDPSKDNTFIDNNVSLNLFGIQVEASTLNHFLNNVFKDNILYGLFFDAFSSGNNADGNDFINNNEGETQAYDDGGNHFANNFWSDLEDPSQPYTIDGAAGSVDLTPADEPNNFDAPFAGIPYVIYPNGKEHLKGTVKVKWTSVDPDPDVTVTYYVFYGKLVEVQNPAGHEWYEENTVNEWILIGSVNNNHKLDWDTRDVDNGKYLIKVIAENNGYERFDTSDRFFHVENKKKTTVPTSPGFELLGIIGLIFVGVLYKKKTT